MISLEPEKSVETKKRSFEVVDCGTKDYDEVHRLQKSLVEARRDSLILVQHPEVYTFGRREKNVSVAQFDGPVREVERGGEATFHNPGQLVAYPILRLEPQERDLHLHLRRLEEVTIRSLNDFGIFGGRKAGATGVWVAEGSRKIASVGVAVSRWVTYHGVALNVINELHGFSRINPCGFEASVMTSMAQELGFDPDFEMVKRLFLVHFCTVFDRMKTSSA